VNAGWGQAHISSVVPWSGQAAPCISKLIAGYLRGSVGGEASCCRHASGRCPVSVFDRDRACSKSDIVGPGRMALVSRRPRVQSVACPQKDTSTLAEKINGTRHTDACLLSTGTAKAVSRAMPDLCCHSLHIRPRVARYRKQKRTPAGCRLYSFSAEGCNALNIPMCGSPFECGQDHTWLPSPWGTFPTDTASIISITLSHSAVSVPYFRPLWGSIDEIDRRSSFPP